MRNPCDVNTARCYLPFASETYEAKVDLYSGGQQSLDSLAKVKDREIILCCQNLSTTSGK